MAEETQGIKFNLDEFDESLVQEVVEVNPEANPLEGPPPQLMTEFIALSYLFSRIALIRSGSRKRTAPIRTSLSVSSTGFVRTREVRITTNGSSVA